MLVGLLRKSRLRLRYERWDERAGSWPVDTAEKARYR